MHLKPYGEWDGNGNDQQGFMDIPINDYYSITIEMRLNFSCNLDFIADKVY